MFILNLPFSQGQTVKVQKKSTNVVSDFIHDLNFHDRRYFQGLESKKLRIGEQELFLFSKKNATLSQTYDVKNDRRSINSRSTAGIKSLELPLEGSIDIIGQNGEFVYSDVGHGDVETLTFYGSDLNIKSKYKPYRGTFSNFYLHSNGSVVAILCQEDYMAEKYSISLHNLNGTVINSSNLTGDKQFLVSGIQVVGSQILILYSSLSSAGSKVVALDLNLNIIWQQDFNNAIIKNQLVTKESGILVNTITESSLLELSSGRVLWNKPNKSNRSITISSQFVLSGKYIASLLGSYQTKSGKTIYSTTVHVYDTNSGEEVFSDTDFILSNQRPELFSLNDNRFVVRYEEAKSTIYTLN